MAPCFTMLNNWFVFLLIFIQVWTGVFSLISYTFFLIVHNRPMFDLAIYQVLNHGLTEHITK